MDFASSFALITPELILAGAGLILLLWTAWAGDKAARAISLVAVLAFFAAGVTLAPGLHTGATGPDTLAFGGLLKADSFALFSKALIYLAAIGCLLIAPGFFNSEAAGA
ncbi:MAG: NADH-quinone oxidoreductase subunit N, partial [Pseudomonadota bacterium]